MGDFKILSENDIEALSSKERREYQKKLKEYNNSKMVNDIINQDSEEISVDSAQNRNMTDTTKVTNTKKKSNAGRKAIDAAERKQQIMLTIEANSKNKLESVDPRNFKKYLGRYIDKNIDEIVEAIKKL